MPEPQDPTVHSHANAPEAAPSKTTATPVAARAVGGHLFVLPVRGLMLQEHAVIWIHPLSLASKKPPTTRRCGRPTCTPYAPPRLTVIPKAFAASGRPMRRSAIPKAAWRYGGLVRHPWPTWRSCLTPFLRSAAMLALAPGFMYYGNRDDERA